MNLSPFVWSLLLGLAAGGANVLGGLVVVSRRSWNKAALGHFIALGAGFMLAATLLRMLPESFRLTPLAPMLILGGYFLVHFFEHTVAPHFHFGEEVHDEVMTLHAFVGFSALFGLSVHALPAMKTPAKADVDLMAERAGFEPAVPLSTRAFQARSFGHSDTSP